MHRGSHYLTRDLPDLAVRPNEPVYSVGRRCARELIDEMARPTVTADPIYLTAVACIHEYMEALR